MHCVGVKKSCKFGYEDCPLFSFVFVRLNVSTWGFVYGMFVWVYNSSITWA